MVAMFSFYICFGVVDIFLPTCMSKLVVHNLLSSLLICVVASQCHQLVLGHFL